MNYEMPVAYWIPRGQIRGMYVKPQGFPLPIAPDLAGQLPQMYGSRHFTNNGSNEDGAPEYHLPGLAPDNSLAFGGYSGHNFLRRDCKPGAK